MDGLVEECEERVWRPARRGIYRMDGVGGLGVVAGSSGGGGGKVLCVTYAFWKLSLIFGAFLDLYFFDYWPGHLVFLGQ